MTLKRKSSLVALAAAGALATGGLQVAAASHAHAATASPVTPIWSTQLQWDNNGTAWSEASFAALKADGLNSAEINMPWGTIEPSAGTFSFTELDTELANASAAGIQLIPIFWQSGWGGSPASWITDFEVSDTGATGSAPAWWNTTEQSEYFTYVTDTIQHIAGEAGYGGSILNYGFLDAQWDLNGTPGGWASADITEFQNTYLPATYGTIATFNSDFSTTYTSFSQVPAADPGQALAGVYQAFRAWSVQTTYNQLTADVRNITASTPLYYYYGGHLGNAPSYANNPDVFFKLAKQYNVAIVDDAAQSPGLTLTFGSLARAYGVKVAQEWTAPSDSTQLGAQAVQWLSNYAMGLPDGAGEDFFIHDSTQKDTVGFPIYLKWVSTLQGMSGSYPQQPAAVYMDLSQGYGNTSGGSVAGVEDALTAMWENYQSGFAVVTSQEVNNGAVSLSQFKAVYPLNGVDANLTAYQNGGGTVLTQAGQMASYAPAYAQLANASVLQVVPTVASSNTSAALTLANITSGTAYDNQIAIVPSGLNLNSGTYHLVDAATGNAVPQTVQSDGTICATAGIAAASLAEWNVVAGAAPSGTASATCPTSTTGATTVTATPGSTSGGLSFLGIGQTNQGADGNLTQITQSGTPAVETWTTSQSGSGGANVYLQLDPFSAVATASTVNLQVTYWASSGQGFMAQYDTATNAYQNGPSVTSPGTGTWATATVQLTGAHFDGAQNMGADLRLAVTTPSQTLIVSKVTMSTVSSSGSATLSASPASLSFGSEVVGSTTAAQSVTVSNTGGAAATISSVSVSGPFAQTNNCGTSLAAGASCTASVTFTPTATGSASGTLTVASNATNASLSAALSGTGTSTSTTNLALNAPITASSHTQNYVPANADDGNTGTYWESTDGVWPSTLTVNLGATHSLSSVVVDLPPLSVWQTRTQTFSILGSTNNSTWTTLVASATYTFNPSTGNTVTIKLSSGTSEQYVELSFTANSVQNGAQVSELGIY
ncbi:choice-of-anchor D domain-containing protein [Actinospica sp.]|uniref:choice-of-anchor D domain-containing protein n=1 Tax=Actinospica sp. TaxID=1872142 RepID=UPI002CF3A085|nr:choice-of-anchor D domain-containing protein [Actinospica sp.]HWG26465.1 choice-of-anchor D domain-containing protein [Actinospica sp.]